MCGRLACTLCPEEICDKANYKNKLNEIEKPKWIDSQYLYKPFYNGAPSAIVPLMCASTSFPDYNDYPEYCLLAARWGMLPTYKTETKGNFHTHNARLEGLLNSSLYKPSLVSGKRCVILADGFYEWQTTQSKSNRQPFFIYQEPNDTSTDKSKNKYLMKFAGLYNIIRDANCTCTMLTTESEENFSWLHHRVPVILNTDEEIDKWLCHKTENIADFLKSLPKSSQSDKKFELKHHAVNNYVNSSSCNEEKCMLRMSVKRKSNTLDAWLKKK